MEKFNKPLYGAMVNLSGLYNKKPMKLRYHDFLGEYSTYGGNVCFAQLGVEFDDTSYPGCIKFCSVDKKDVEFWICGVLSLGTILSCSMYNTQFLKENKKKK